jgi:hypothetical protein
MRVVRNEGLIAPSVKEEIELKKSTIKMKRVN